MLVSVMAFTPATALSGMDAFARTFSPERRLLVGAGGMPLETFFHSGPELLTGP